MSCIILMGIGRVKGLTKFLISELLQSHINFLINVFLSFPAEMLHQIYPELLKRMDDSSDEIRIVVTKTFLAYFK